MAISDSAMVLLYQSGMSYKCIAALAECPIGTVSKRLKRAGVGAERAPRLSPSLVDAVLAEMRASHERKMCIEQLAKHCGVSRKTIYNLEAAHGVRPYRSPEHAERYRRASQPVSE